MTGRERLLTVMLVLSGLVVGGAVAEAALRLSTVMGSDLGRLLDQWDPMSILIEPHGAFGFRQVPLVAFHYSNGTVARSNAQGYRGDTVAIPKPHNTFRVVLLGGSTTHGWGVNDEETIDAHLQSILRERYPRRRIEVVNLAFDAYDAYQLYQRLVTDGIPRQPDVVIVNTGINDVRNAKIEGLEDHDRRTLIMEADLERLRIERDRGGPTLRTRLKHHLFLFRLPGVLRVQLEHRREVQTTRSRPPNPEAITQFLLNVARIDSIAAAHDMAVVFSTPPSALPAYPPDAKSGISYWLRDAATTQAYRDTLAFVLADFAETRSARRPSVRYVRPMMGRGMFLDDCHLASAGNRRMALEYAKILGQWIEVDYSRVYDAHLGSNP